MASGTLYTYPKSYRAYKALIAAEYSGARVTVDQQFIFGQTNKTPEFLAKFPLGKVPAFESADKKVLLTESNAIAYYLSNKDLKGKTPVDEAKVIQWLDFADSEIFPSACVLTFPVLNIIKAVKEHVQRALSDIKQALNVLNAYLLNNTYLVGERITLADISIACNLLNLYQYVLDPNLRKPYGNVTRWFTTIINQPQVKKVVGEIQLCKEKVNYDKLYEKSSEGTKKSEPKQQVQQQPKSKQEAKPKPPPAQTPAAGGDEDEDGFPQEPKAKDPLDALPKGTWVMDDFKRFYSNNEETLSIPYFWEKFDPANYSIWFGEYKFPEELRKDFMSCNLISGMYQRLDKMRKNAFASCCLFGNDTNASISGIWIWRGQELAFPLSPDWQVDYESYEWKKLDPADPKTKELVNQYLSWTGTDKAGRKFNQGKIFK